MKFQGSTGRIPISKILSIAFLHRLDIISFAIISKRIYSLNVYMSRLMTKTNKMTVRQAKTQISLGIRPVWSESSLCPQWVAKNLNFLHVDSDVSDQTGRMSRLIWVSVGFVMRRFSYIHKLSYTDQKPFDALLPTVNMEIGLDTFGLK